MSPTFSAVLLAGGKSQRMGRDKVVLPTSEGLLWQRQLRVLEALNPEKIFWSGSARPGLPPHVLIVPDAINRAGPLAGITACLGLVSTDLLVVLAVDLPRMDADYLRALVGRCTATIGAVPQHGKNFEPLAAVYPRLVRSLAADRLRQGHYKMQEFIQEAQRRDLIAPVPIADNDMGKFKNVNSPEEFAELE